MKLFVLSLFLAIFQLFYLGESVRWTFKSGKYGPSRWPKYFRHCKSKKQSPINIPLNGSRYQPSLRNTLEFAHYTCPCFWLYEIKNTGRTLKIDVPDEAAVTLTLNGTKRFKLAQLHLHWGSNNGKGSEHLFDNTSFPAELHLVHYNMEYHSLWSALRKQDGVAVLGVMIKVGRSNPAFSQFVKYTNFVKRTGREADIPPFSLKSLLPSNTKDFFRYKGSLTTPPCFDNVIWTVFYNPIEISQKQLNKFRILRNMRGKPLVDNFRPVQNLNGRTVECSFQITSAEKKV